MSKWQLAALVVLSGLAQKKEDHTISRPEIDRALPDIISLLKKFDYKIGKLLRIPETE